MNFQVNYRICIFFSSFKRELEAQYATREQKLAAGEAQVVAEKQFLSGEKEALAQIRNRLQQRSSQFDEMQVGCWPTIVMDLNSIVFPIGSKIRVLHLDLQID